MLWYMWCSGEQKWDIIWASAAMRAATNIFSSRQRYFLSKCFIVLFWKQLQKSLFRAGRVKILIKGLFRRLKITANKKYTVVFRSQTTNSARRRRYCRFNFVIFKRILNIVAKIIMLFWVASKSVRYKITFTYLQRKIIYI